MKKRFLSDVLFSKEWYQKYNFTYCISGTRIITGFDIQMIDACHVVPFAVSHNDTISNGISLSPNLHRAFGRGLVTLDHDYKVMVSTSFTKNETNSSIKRYEGKLIILPDNGKYYPAQENLEWHRENIFKK